MLGLACAATLLSQVTCTVFKHIRALICEAGEQNAPREPVTKQLCRVATVKVD
jgi:hypothetical protein